MNVAHPIEADEENQPKKKSSWISWVMFILVLAGVFFVFHYVIGIIVVSGNSMSPTVENDDVLIANNLFYTPDRNDVVIFRDENGFDVIKRIIALPNETVEIKSGVVYVNGGPIDEDFVAGTPNDMPETVVEENTYFVMGDNREPGESKDSRDNEVGSISRESIEGEILISLFPFGFLK